MFGFLLTETVEWFKMVKDCLLNVIANLLG